LQIPSPYFCNFLQVFCKSILITKSICSITKKRGGEIGKDFNTTFFKNIDLIDFKRFFIQKIEKIKTKKKPIISDRLAPSLVGSCNHKALIELARIRNLMI
jgi:hypothetical protein